MDVINAIKSKLKQYPGISYDSDDHFITVYPGTPTGFSVTLIAKGSACQVFFDSWHTDLESEEEALNCFAFGLSDKCRLKIELRGQVACKWTVEYQNGGKWIQDSTTGLLLVPFWRKPETVYRQNSLIDTFELSQK